MVSEQWSRLNVLRHINEKELLAVLLSLTHFRLQLQNKTVLICTDSMVALHYIRKQGGTRSEGLIPLALQLWDFAIRNNMALQVRHVPGKENVIADHLSRLHGIYSHSSYDYIIYKYLLIYFALVEDRVEYVLCEQVFQQIATHYHPTIDLFASRTTAQLSRYVSFYPDCQAQWTNAFSKSWLGELPYIYPPTILLPRVLQKIYYERVRAVIVAPYWPQQTYFVTLQQMAVEPPWILPRKWDLVLCAKTNTPHPLAERLELAVWLVQG